MPLLCKGKYYCAYGWRTAWLVWIQLVCYVKIINRFIYLFGWIQTSKTGGQPTVILPLMTPVCTASGFMFVMLWRLWPTLENLINHVFRSELVPEACFKMWAFGLNLSTSHNLPLTHFNCRKEYNLEHRYEWKERPASNVQPPSFPHTFTFWRINNYVKQWYVLVMCHRTNSAFLCEIDHGVLFVIIELDLLEGKGPMHVSELFQFILQLCFGTNVTGFGDILTLKQNCINIWPFLRVSLFFGKILDLIFILLGNFSFL